MKSNSKKILSGGILILLSYGFIIYKIISFKELEEFSFNINNYSSFDASLLLSVLVLMFLNWAGETFKWKILIAKIQYFYFFDAFKAVFVGITVGIFTPNRIGEIGGRVLFLEKGKRTFGILATGIGSLAQFITTIAMGILGFALFLTFYPEKTHISFIFNNISAIILILILIALIWSYFNNKRIKAILEKFSFFKHREDQLEYLSETKAHSLTQVLILSILRYFIFSLQFYLLLILFDVNLIPLQAFVSISLTYLFATLIPTTTLASLGIRGSLSIFFIGLFSNNVVGIILAPTFLWFINLAIPSIIGSILFIKKKS